MCWRSIVRGFLEGFAESRLPPNTVRLDSGELAPERGYHWASDMPGDPSVRWGPGTIWEEQKLVAGQEPGKWHPAPGYV